MFKIRPANIFITKNEKNEKDKTIIIGDFGLSIRASASHLKSSPSFEDRPSLSLKDSQILTKNVGTPLYLAPEQEQGSNYDSKVDIYALGLILLELFSNFKTIHERNCVFSDLKKKKKLPEEIKRKFKNEAGLILKMTSKDPNERPASDKIMECEDFKKWAKECSIGE